MMASMRIQVAQVARRILSQRRDAFLHDMSLPGPVRGMISVHLDGGWIPNFWTLAIRAPKLSPSSTSGQRAPSVRGYFDFPIGLAEDGTSWFFPSRQWWIAHAHASHPPDGTGCEADVHTKFLSSEGDVHEFDYATVFQDGTLKILGRADFVQECFFWQHAFGTSEVQQP
jgi:hypothetical protein